MAVANHWNPTADYGQANPASFDINHPSWVNEVLTARESRLFIARTVQNRTPDFASGNKTAEFVTTGSVGTKRFNKGDLQVGSNRKQFVREFGLNDRPYYTALEDEKLERRFEQVDTRFPLTQSMGYSLAARVEVEVMRRICLSARYRKGSDVPAEFRHGGNSYHGSDDSTGYTASFAASQTGAKNLQTAIKAVNLKFDQMNIKREGRFCFIDTALFYEFRELENVWPSSTNVLAGGIYGNLDIAGPKLDHSNPLSMDQPLYYMGVMILPSNLINATYDAGVSGLKADWSSDPDVAGDFSSTVGAIYQSDCVGHVDLMTTRFKIEDIQRTEDQIISAMDWTGGGSFVSECAVELVTS